MSKTIYIEPQDAPEVVKVAKLAFPEYNGRKYKVVVTEVVHVSGHEWSGGSRTSAVAVNLYNGTTMPVSNAEVPLIPGCVVVKHVIFCGKDFGIEVFVCPANVNQLALPAPQEVTLHERIVLIATRNYKSAYAGRSNYRFYEAHRETRISSSEWEIAKASCTAKGYLTKGGAITASGRNIVGMMTLFELMKQSTGDQS